MRTYVLERAQTIPRSRRETFAFFSNAFNLERITPPFLHFRILTPPIEMRAGQALEYRLSLYGVTFRWRTMIQSWVPDEWFVDLQTKGPYALWRHTHTFEPLGPHQTLMRDRVEYQIPCGMVGRLAHRLFVVRLLARIFDYRAETTARLLAPPGEPDLGDEDGASDVSFRGRGTARGGGVSLGRS
jgi:ligand-binding SRPBCC domain-containing protein